MKSAQSYRRPDQIASLYAIVEFVDLKFQNGKFGGRQEMNPFVTYKGAAAQTYLYNVAEHHKSSSSPSAMNDGGNLERGHVYLAFARHSSRDGRINMLSASNFTLY